MNNEFLSNISGRSQFYFSDAGKNYTTDEINTHFAFKKSFREKFVFHSGLDYKRLSNQNINLTMDNINFKNSLKYSTGNTYVAPTLGTVFLNKYRKRESAVSYGIESGYEYSDETTSLSGNLVHEAVKLPQKPESVQRLRIHYFSKFNEVSHDSLFLEYSRKKYADYFNENLDMEKIDITQYRINNHLLLYRKGSNNLENRTSFQLRDFNQDRPLTSNQRVELNFQNDLYYKYIGKKLKSSILVRNFISENDYSENILDNEHILFVINPMLVYAFNSRHQLITRMYYSKLEYNTPDSLKNFDDRDEIRFNLNTAYQYSFSSDLNYSIYLDGNYFHQVYLFEERSSLNKEEYILSLGSNIYLRKGDLVNYVDVKISSYYLTYDFANKLGTVQNVMNRKLSLTDTLKWNISDLSTISVAMKYEKEEIGALDWADFVSTLERENYQKYLHLAYRYNFDKEFFLMPGFSFIFRKDYFLPGTRKVIRDYKSRGFWLKGRYQLSSYSFVNLEINKILYSNLNTPDRSYFTGKLEVAWVF